MFWNYYSQSFLFLTGSTHRMLDVLAPNLKSHQKKVKLEYHLEAKTQMNAHCYQRLKSDSVDEILLRLSLLYRFHLQFTDSAPDINEILLVHLSDLKLDLSLHPHSPYC